MKIGIITIQRSEVNFGANLQAYALWRFVSSLGHSVEVIDLLRPCHKAYIPEGGMSFKSILINTIRSIKNMIRPVSNDQKVRQSKIRSFNGSIDYSPTYNSIKQLYQNPPSYDLYISGSDQIWNPNMPYRSEPYFLTFTDRRKISYASSIGVSQISDETKEKYKIWLKDYKDISVREDSAAELLKGILGFRPSVVVDPVFLLSREEWTALSKPYAGITPGKYIFVYMLSYDERVIAFAHKISQSKGIPIYYSVAGYETIENSPCKQIQNIGPLEWIWLINNADTVVTTSFHGTAISVLLGTPFFVMVDKKKTTNSRISDLLVDLGMADHIVDMNASDCKLSDSKLDDTGYIDKLQSKIEASKEYLKNAIADRND